MTPKLHQLFIPKSQQTFSFSLLLAHVGIFTASHKDVGEALDKMRCSKHRLGRVRFAVSGAGTDHLSVLAGATAEIIGPSCVCLWLLLGGRKRLW